jgi:hypothetical protein
MIDYASVLLAFILGILVTLFAWWLVPPGASSSAGDWAYEVADDWATGYVHAVGCEPSDDGQALCYFRLSDRAIYSATCALAGCTDLQMVGCYHQETHQ